MLCRTTNADRNSTMVATCAGEVSLVRTLSAVVGGAVNVLHGDCGMPQGLGMLAMWMISY